MRAEFFDVTAFLGAALCVGLFFAAAVQKKTSAPEPWGPWTTVYFTGRWDVGPGENSRFPTKWMSADSKTLYLAFSGDDYFSVRRAELTLEGRSALSSR